MKSCPYPNAILPQDLIPMSVIDFLNPCPCFPWKTSMAQGNQLCLNKEPGLTYQEMRFQWHDSGESQFRCHYLIILTKTPTDVVSIHTEVYARTLLTGF